MKRSVPILVAALLACTLTCPALAAGEQEPESTPPVLYPVEVTEYTEGDHPRINKVYALTASQDPAAIPTADFVREGRTYTLLDLTRQDLTENDTKAHTETVTLESKMKDMDKIMPLLPTTQEVTTEDGYVGILTLDTTSIKVEAAGYGTSSKTVTATRSYPNLSDADTSFVPKTIEDNGRTLTLADVQWQEAGGYYHATATYTGTATSRYATGYLVTANYTGEVSKTASDTILYTAIFSGTPISPSLTGEAPAETEPPAPTASPAATGSSGWNWLYLLPIGAGAAGVAALAVYGSKKFKAKKEWEDYNKCDGK